MKRRHKEYSRPKTPFDKPRIEEEAKIKEEFGLKNKQEIWKAESRIKLIRERAKKLIGASGEEQSALFERLKKIGLDVNTIADILSLDKKDYLNRRLQTIIFRKKLASTVKGARQLITHKKVLVNGNVVSSPSYIVPLELENEISLKKGRSKPKDSTLKESVVPENEAPIEEDKQELNVAPVAN